MINTITLKSSQELSICQWPRCICIRLWHKEIQDTWWVKYIDHAPIHYIMHQDIRIIRIHEPTQVVSYLQDHIDISHQIQSWIIDVCIVSLYHWIDIAYTMTECIKSRHRCPMMVSSQSQAVDFCRLIMLHHHGIPKYLMHGQSLVWNY